MRLPSTALHIIPKYMPENRAPLLARLLFPKAQPHLQRKLLRHLGFALLVGLIIAAAVGALIYFQGSKIGPAR